MAGTPDNTSTQIAPTTVYIDPELREEVQSLGYSLKLALNAGLLLLRDALPEDRERIIRKCNERFDK